MANESAVLSFCPACFKDVFVESATVARFRCPHCQRDFQRADLRTIVPLPPAAIALDEQGEPVAPAPDSPQTEAARAAASPDVAGWAPEGPAAPAFSPGDAPSLDTSAPRRRRRSVGIVGQLIGVVGGGVFGLALGYAILLKIRGPAFDPLHLADDVPGWMLPAPDQPAVNDDNVSTEQLKRTWEEASPFKTYGSNGKEASKAPADDASQTLEPGLHPKAFASISMDDFDKKLAEAEQAVLCKKCGGAGSIPPKGADEKAAAASAKEKDAKTDAALPPATPCPTCRGRGTNKLTPARYAALASAAHDTALVRLDGVEPDEINGVVTRAEGLMLAAAGDLDDAQAIGRFAATALVEVPRKETGILLTGTVMSFGKAGKLHTMEVVLMGQATPVLLIGRAPMDKKFAIKDHVVVAGLIIDIPNVQLVEYEGEDRPVVFVGLPLPLGSRPE